MKSYRLVLMGFLFLASSLAFAADAPQQDDALSLQIQQLKQQVLDVNSELRILEQQLLYPSSETAFFLSVDVGTPIRLVDVNVSLDGKHIAYHFYTRQEFEALAKGGIERIYNDNVASGQHTLEVVVTGYTPQGKNYSKSSTYTFVKGPGRKYLEIHASDDLNTMQPKFEFREWDK